LLDLRGDPVQVCHIHLPLIKSTNHGIQNLIPVKGLTGAIPLYYDDRQTFHDLVCSKSSLTFQTFTTAANAQTVLTVPGIYNFAVLVSAKRTFHSAYSPLI
jgi:hypothetical protein